MTNFTFTHSKPGNETIGDWVREKNRSLFGSGMRWYNRNSPVGRRAVAMEKETLVKDANGKEWILKPDGTKILASARKAKQQVARNNTQITIDSSIAFAPWNQPSNIDQEKDINQQVEVTQQPPQHTTTTTRTGTGKYRKNVIKRKITPKGQEYWNNKYQTFLDSMTDDQEKWLKQRGIDYNSAEAMQKYLQSMGKNIGKFGADNKWGDDSQTAWNDFVNTTMKKNPLQTPTEEQPVVDASDPFGYSTTNHYGDGMALKGLGFNNYTGLKNYVIANPNDQFAKDLKKRFGEDTSTWKQADVEGGLGVSGTYRGGYVGDFGDMARSMMNWAAETNAAHDKKELTSRTDSDGNVYGNSNVAKLFDKYSISSKIADIKKQKFPDLDFNLKQGNIGISTLGNQPGMFDASNYE